MVKRKTRGFRCNRFRKVLERFYGKTYRRFSAEKVNHKIFVTSGWCRWCPLRGVVRRGCSLPHAFLWDPLEPPLRWTHVPRPPETYQKEKSWGPIRRTIRNFIIYEAAFDLCFAGNSTDRWRKRPRYIKYYRESSYKETISCIARAHEIVGTNSFIPHNMNFVLAETQEYRAQLRTVAGVPKITYIEPR